MKRMLSYITADVFTAEPFGGNPVAVFPDARSLSAEEMRLIAREFNLSETVFVLPAEDPRHSCGLRIFTPGMELPFAGHPTLGAASVLAEIGRVPATGTTVFEEVAGPVTVELTDTFHARLTAPRIPEFGPEPSPPAEMATLLSLRPEEVLTGDLRPATVSGGVPFLVIPVASVESLGRVRLDLRLWEEHIRSFWAPHIYPIARAGDTTIRARMFAPAMGISEDPATGAAATALARFLVSFVPQSGNVQRWEIVQGVEMGRQSELELTIDTSGGEIRSVGVGGRSVIMSRGELRM